MSLVIAGTRPEAIKIAPILEWIDRLGLERVFVWSGQHYDYLMSEVFFRELALPEPDVNLDVKSGSHAEQTAKVMLKLEKVLEKESPAPVLAEGDTNTTLAAALASVKAGVPFGHVEAGLRSWDMSMPEEINKIVQIRRIWLTGNTIVDVVTKFEKRAEEVGQALISELGMSTGEYALLTIHRQENTDNREGLSMIVEGVCRLARRMSIVFPVHPRTEKRLRKWGLWSKLEEYGVRLIPPLATSPSWEPRYTLE